MEGSTHHLRSDNTPFPFPSLSPGVMVRHPLHLSPPPPNRTGCSGMVLCLTELGSGDLFCWNVAKLPGVTEKEKG